MIKFWTPLSKNIGRFIVYVSLCDKNYYVPCSGRIKHIRQDITQNGSRAVIILNGDKVLDPNDPVFDNWQDYYEGMQFKWLQYINDVQKSIDDLAERASKFQALMPFKKLVSSVNDLKKVTDKEYVKDFVSATVNSQMTSLNELEDILKDSLSTVVALKDFTMSNVDNTKSTSISITSLEAIKRKYQEYWQECMEQVSKKQLKLLRPSRKSS